jgi:hypothetical protein
MNHDATRFDLRHLVTALCAIAVLAFGAGPARAGVPGADLYLGVGLGQSNVDVSAADLGVLKFDKEDIAWKAYVGGRFLSFAGAELDYINFGKPDGGNAKLKYTGLAAFGLYYLPIPLPLLDVYLKAGFARLDVNGSLNFKDTKLAYGAGLQLNLSSFALRGEYERFKAQGAKPSLLSVGFQKSFL